MGIEFSSNPPEMTKVTIDMPVSMHEQLQLQARLSGAGSVTEFLRRGAAVYGALIEKALDHGVLASDTVAEVTLRTPLEHVKLNPFLPFADA